MNDDEALQRELTALALRVLEGRSFALAGSGAIREHGMVDRLTHDVDLFTNDPDPAVFEDAVDTLLALDRDAGFEVGMFAQQLDQVSRIAPRRFEEYGVDAEQLAGIRERFARWAGALRASGASPA